MLYCTLLLLPLTQQGGRKEIFPLRRFYFTALTAFFTESVSKLQCSDVVCLGLPSRKIHFQVDWILLVEERIANIGLHLDILAFCCFEDFSCVLNLFWIFVSLRTSLLCIMVELAGGGSVAVQQ